MKNYFFIQYENGYVDFWIKPSLKKSKSYKQIENLMDRFSILLEEYLELPYKLNEAIENEKYEYAAWLRDHLPVKQERGKPSIYRIEIPKIFGKISFLEIESSTEIQQFIQENRKVILNPKI